MSKRNMVWRLVSSTSLPSNLRKRSMFSRAIYLSDLVIISVFIVIILQTAGRAAKRSTCCSRLLRGALYRRSRGHCVQDEDQAKKNSDAHAERSGGIRSVSIRDSESVCLFHCCL